MTPSDSSSILLVPYDITWPAVFQHTQQKICRHTGLALEDVEHIGSTSIPGATSKPIIDLLIGLTALEECTPTFEKQLQQCGFYRLKVQKKDEIIFAKFADQTFQTKTHFIHVVKKHQRVWKELLYFRDTLRTDQQLLHQYLQLKQQISKDDGITHYTNEKEAFVKQVCQSI